MKAYAISVMVPDRVGVLRDVSKVIFELRGNIGDLRQNIVDGCFTLTCIASFPQGKVGTDIRAVRTAIQASVGDGSVMVQEFTPPKHAPVINGERYVFTVQGSDKPGRVFCVSDFFALRGINVEDWSHRITASGLAFNSGTVTVPQDIDVGTMQADFVKHLAKHGLTAKLMHENIFKATNSIGAIHNLFRNETNGTYGTNGTYETKERNE